ncbi:hypothetical protein SAY87_018398 [Trapa incisa]|uniref:Bifunctional inhibitor/plant lipid transfer protein/seed storage helical domain-containing protein n=1 Tax=Trapa incisa TaxID=236973 RepID=A0AAN7L3C4_9MYRT|nr:hypothetical protein SAY87_018398 [Trapa incisa]
MLIAAIFGRCHAWGYYSPRICNVPVSGLYACMPAATPPNPPPPTAACCNSLVNANYGCLCSDRVSSELRSHGVDPNLAMLIPGKCGLPNPGHS